MFCGVVSVDSIHVFFVSDSTDEELAVSQVIRALVAEAPWAIPVPRVSVEPPLPPLPLPRVPEAAPEEMTTEPVADETAEPAASADWVDMPALYRELHGLNEEEQPEQSRASMPTRPRGYQR